MKSQVIEDQRLSDAACDPKLHKHEQIKQELRLRIQEALQTAKTLTAKACLEEIRKHLLSIQQYCQSVEKTFIFVEQEITCDQYKLQGSQQDVATLFRGPNEDASVAICVTQKGSLLYRNGCWWIIYRNMGDIKPLSEATATADS